MRLRLAVVTLIGTAGVSRGAVSQSAKLVQTFNRIEHKPIYRQSTWGYDVLDQRTGKVLASQNAQQMFDPGSTMKLYSVSTGLRLYGTHYRFRTPVYREGTVADGTLTGNLVLVGSGDLTFGLRELPGDRLAYENLPAGDHSYADQLPGASCHTAIRGWRCANSPNGSAPRGSPGSTATS